MQEERWKDVPEQTSWVIAKMLAPCLAGMHAWHPTHMRLQKVTAYILLMNDHRRVVWLRVTGP